jgi:hypothetical protein
MQNAVINPTDQRTKAEVASMPNLRGSQDAFLRTVRYIANEGLTKYELQHALERAHLNKDFDPNYWTLNPEYSGVSNNASKRRDLALHSTATQDRPSWMRGAIDESSYKGERKGHKLTAKELREQANQPD